MFLTFLFITNCNCKKKAIAKRLVELREKSGFSQKNFALESGRDKQSYNKNEKGKGTTIYTVNKFCIEQGITLKVFFDSPYFLKRQKR